MARILTLILTILPFCVIKAQNRPLHSLLQKAEENYASIKSKKMMEESAKAGIESSVKSNAPSLDAAYQLNYATHNNISGMASSQFFVPISGPVAAANNYSPVFGTVTGLLFNWQPVTFGKLPAQIAFAKAGASYASADLANEILQHKVKLANAYLDAITIDEIDKVFTENIQRTEANLSVARTLVTAGIKPGVDTALYASELSRAKIEQINNRSSREKALIVLQQLSAQAESIDIHDSSYFHRLPDNRLAADSIQHPLLSLYLSSVELDKAKKNMIAKTASPVLGTWSTAYARGSGILSDGSVKAADGFGLQRYNYGVGLQLSMPLLQSVKIKPQLKQQDFLIRADEEKYNEINQQLISQQQIAESAFQNAMAVVKENAIQLSSAEYAYRAIVSRYSAGLANYADVIQAQYQLLKAGTEEKANYMAVWKALLFKAAVSGDLNLFLKQVN